MLSTFDRNGDVVWCGRLREMDGEGARGACWDCVGGGVECLSLGWCRSGVGGEGELVGQPANPGSPGKMAVKTESVCVCVTFDHEFGW